jgi:hypothetical protein
MTNDIRLTVLFLLLIQHFLFDWILQPRWVAINKSKNLVAIIIHTVIVTIGFSIPSFCVFTPRQAILVSCAYGLLHGAQDRIVWSTFRPKTDIPYGEKQFWNRIAIDQFIHLAVGIVLLKGIIPSI